MRVPVRAARRNGVERIRFPCGNAPLVAPGNTWRRWYQAFLSAPIATRQTGTLVTVDPFHANHAFQSKSVAVIAIYNKLL
jgi:hypothetical protein